jgi:hypothetical protein
MPNNNSKKQSIYKPTSGKRLSKKRIYKLLKKDKMNGGGMFDGLSAFFGGDPEKIDESKSSGVEPPSDEQLAPPSDETPSDEQLAPPSDETPSDETSSDETPSIETSSDETPSIETPSIETPSIETPSIETPESNIDGQGNLDNSLSVSDNKEGSSLFVTALKGVGNTISNSVSNTAEEVSAAVNSPDIINDDDDEDNEDDDDDDDDDDEQDNENDDKNKLMEIIADQNKTIDNQNTTIDNLNQTIKEQSDKLVEVFEKQILDLKQNTTDGNTIQYPPVTSPMSMGSPSMSPDTNSPMSIDNMDSQAKRPGVGGKTKGRRSTKKHRNK